MAYLVTVNIDLAKYAGESVDQGSASFQLSGLMQDITANRLYPPIRQSVTLTAGVGSIQLPATKNDPDISPTGLTYIVRLYAGETVDKSFEIELDKDLGANQHLADLPPAVHITTNTYASVAAVNSHIAASTNVHGIADTAQLATLADVAANVPEWGNVSGTLSAQTDLATALDAKQDTLGFTPLDAASDLADVADAATARFNIIANRDRGWISVGDHAAGDGVTNDTAGLQAALSAGINENRPLDMPPGIFLYDALTASAPVTIIGASIAGEETTTGTTILKARTAGQTLFSLGASALTSGTYHYTLQNLTLDGNDLATIAINVLDWHGVALTLHDVVIRHCNTSGINVGSGIHAFLMDWRNVTTRHCPIGANLVGYIQASTFDHCHFAGSSTAGVKIAGSALTDNDNNAILFSGCTFEDQANAGAIGLSIDSCQTVHVDGCYFETFGSSTAVPISLNDSVHTVNLRVSSSYFNGASAAATAIHVPSTARTNGISITLDDCNVSNYTTGVVDHPTTSGVSIRAHIIGTETFRSENRGTATIAAGTDSVTVSHGLFGTPSLVTPQPIGDITPATHLWVSAVDATQFTIKTNAAVTSATNVLWSADCRTLGTVVGSTGLVAQYAFSDGSGQTLTDSSGNGHNATLGATSAVASDDPTWASTGLTFDGTADWANVGSLAAMSGLTGFHLIAVVKASAFTTGAHTLVAKDKEFRLQCTSTGAPKTVSWSGSTATTAQHATNLTTGQWYFVDGWRDGSEIGIRIGNGTPTTSTATTNTAPSVTGTTVGIGGYIPDGASNPVEFLDGDLAAVRLYNRRLTNAEITAIYTELQTALAGRGITI